MKKREIVSKVDYVRLSDISELAGRYVCTDCGVPVVDQNAHNTLHSVMSSWAWSLAVLKTAHFSAETHGKYDVIPRINRKTFVPAVHHVEDDNECGNEYVSEVTNVRRADRKYFGHETHRCILKKSALTWPDTKHVCSCRLAWDLDTATGKMRRFAWDEQNRYYSPEPDPEPEESQPDRYEIAWKLWRWTEESDTPSRSSLRAQLSSGNWLKLGDGQLTKHERDDRDLYLARADQVVDMVGKRRYARFLNNGYFKCLEPECKGVEPDFENSDQAFMHARQRHGVNAIFFETDQNEENKS